MIWISDWKKIDLNYYRGQAGYYRCRSLAVVFILNTGQIHTDFSLWETNYGGKAQLHTSCSHRVSPLLEADRRRREIQTLYLQFQGPPFEVPKSGIV